MTNPSNSISLTPAEEAVYQRIYPLISEINAELGERIEMLLLVNVARRLVTLGKPPEEIVEAVRHAAEHQLDHNLHTRSKH